MTHPTSRLARREIKTKLDAKKKKKEQRESRVWRKLNKEYAKEQEAEHELSEYSPSN